MEKTKDKSETTNDKTGRWGCLATFGIFVLVMLVSFGWLHIHNKHKQAEYKKDPPPARKEIVEGFAGIEFPPYRVKETIMETNCFLGDYIDTIKLEFETMPDSEFFYRLDKACEPSIHIEYKNGYEDYHFWYKGDDDKYRVYFLAGQNDHYYDTIRNIYISRGIPDEFIVGVDRFYSITISKDSPEWTVIVGQF